MLVEVAAVGVAPVPALGPVQALVPGPAARRLSTRHARRATCEWQKYVARFARYSPTRCHDVRLRCGAAHGCARAQARDAAVKARQAWQRGAQGVELALELLANECGSPDEELMLPPDHEVAGACAFA